MNLILNPCFYPIQVRRGSRPIFESSYRPHMYMVKILLSCIKVLWPLFSFLTCICMALFVHFWGTLMISYPLKLVHLPSKFTYLILTNAPLLSHSKICGCPLIYEHPQIVSLCLHPALHFVSLAMPSWVDCLYTRSDHK